MRHAAPAVQAVPLPEALPRRVPENRLVLTTDGEAGLNYLCPGIKAFFNYAEPILAGIVTLVKRDFKGVSR